MNKENKMLHRYVLFVRVWKILGHENNNKLFIFLERMNELNVNMTVYFITLNSF